MTLPNQIPPENNQDAFNRVWHWMTRPGATRSPGPIRKDQCVYRAPDGNACGIGCLLLDWLAEAADHPTEDYSIAAIMEPDCDPRFEPVREWLSKVNVGLMGRIQAVHDNAEPADWPDDLRILARDFNLTVPDSSTP